MIPSTPAARREYDRLIGAWLPLLKAARNACQTYPLPTLRREVTRVLDHLPVDALEQMRGDG
jgi:hypothetical protein